MSLDLAIFVTNTFKRQYKTLKKTYRNIDQDFKILLEMLYKNPKSGRSLGRGLYKLRIEGKDIGGKRGGYRVITYYRADLPEDSLYLVSIYSKRQIENIPLNKIKQIMREEGLPST